jgi:hypothetical protein
VAEAKASHDASSAATPGLKGLAELINVAILLIMPPRRKQDSVREPIQVYLTQADRELLDRASAAAGLSRAEVLRRGLRQYGGAVLAEPHPVIAFLQEMADGDWPADMPDDVGSRHDELLAESYGRSPARKKGGKKH